MLFRSPSSTPSVIGLKLSKEHCSKTVDPTLYKSMVGSLMYFTATRPDIMYALSLISRFMETLKETLTGNEDNLWYVNATKDYGVLYSENDDFKLIGCTDSDWARSVDDRKSTSGYVFHLGLGAISWASKKQKIVDSRGRIYGSNEDNMPSSMAEKSTQRFVS